MALVRPSLKSLLERTQSDISDALSIRQPLQRASIVSALSNAIAATSHLIYGNLEWLEKQLFPTTSDSKRLEQWAALFKVSRTPATQAVVPLKFTGVAGSQMQNDIEVRRQSDGQVFRTTTAGTIDGSGSMVVKCVSQTAGVIGNTSVGASFELVNPIAGVNTKGISAIEGVVPGFDAESDESLLRRLLQRIRNRGQGGSLQDYVSWSQDMPGVGRVWAYEDESRSGAIDVYFLTTNIQTPFPSTELIAKVQNTLDSSRPLGARVSVQTLLKKAIHFEIKLPTPSAEHRELIETALRLFFFEKTNPRGVVSIAELKQVISMAIKTESFLLNAPAKDVQLNADEMAILGDVEWD